MYRIYVNTGKKLVVHLGYTGTVVSTQVLDNIKYSYENITKNALSEMLIFSIE